MASQSNHRHAAACHAVAIFSILTPFTSHVAQNGIPFTVPAVIAAHLLLLLAGLLFGLLLYASPQSLRILLLAGVSALFIELQFTPFDSEIAFAAAFAALALLFLGLQRHAMKIAALTFSLLWLGSLFVPTMPYHRGAENPAPGNPDLPPIVHIVLDEHIGIEGIPLEFDPERAIADAVRDNLLRQDFQVYGRAFSRAYWTWDSMASILGFAPPRHPGDRLEPGPKPFKRHLVENRLFDLLHERGYLIRVVQPFATDYCTTAAVAECISYNPYNGFSGNLPALLEEEPSVAAQARLLLASYAPALRKFLQVYDRLQRNGTFGMDLLPRLPPGPVDFSVTPTSTLRQLERIKGMLRRVEPGEALLLHLLLPHSPYVLHTDCSLRPGLSNWLVNAAGETAPRNNDAASRALRYPLYLEQLQCTQTLFNELLRALEESGQGERAIVVVHGDHGSRIDTGSGSFDQRWEEIGSNRDLVDGLSALFAVRLPGRAGAYHREPIPLDRLSDAIYRRQRLPGAEDLEEPPTLLLADDQGHYRQLPMPRFRDGEILPAAEGLSPSR